MINKAICPNCGAEGTVGRYCEFCGTKIPTPIVKQTVSSKSKEHKPRIVRFSITKDDAIELFFNYLYKKGVSFENINLTVVNIKTYSIPFIAYNVYYEYYWTGENEDGIPDNGTLKGEKKIIIPSYDDSIQKLPLFDSYSIFRDSDLYIKESIEGKYETDFDVNISKCEETPNEIWNRLGKEQFSRSIRSMNPWYDESVISKLQDDGVPITIPFYFVHFNLNGKEKDFYVDGLGNNQTYSPRIIGYNILKTSEERVAHYKSFEKYLKQEDIGLTENQKERLLKNNYPSSAFEALEKKKEEKGGKKEEEKEEEIETKSMGKSCLTILLVVVCVIIAVIGLIRYNKHMEQVKLEEQEAEMAEKHVRDSIEQEKAMQQQKEERKKRNYRPSAPTPSYSDVEVIGLPNGIKQIRITSKSKNTIYGFDKQGFLISVKHTDYVTSILNEYCTIKRGKLISKDGKEVEYTKVSTNEDVISCDNYTLCNLIYDSKNRIVKIKKDGILDDTVYKFVYDEGNNAHEEREKFGGGTETAEKMSIPILDIIGNSIDIPQNWEDGVTSSDEQGRPTEIVYDGTLYKETVKIAYW